MFTAEEELPVIELVDPNDARAVRNKDNILALYDLMINKKEAEQAVAKFFAPKYIQHNPLVPDGAAELARFFDKIAKDRANLRIVIHRIVASTTMSGHTSISSICSTTTRRTVGLPALTSSR
jgi:predicted SnoaL-like aldol condensation-catalyzing enzyme